MQEKFFFLRVMLFIINKIIIRAEQTHTLKKRYIIVFSLSYFQEEFQFEIYIFLFYYYYFFSLSLSV